MARAKDQATSAEELQRRIDAERAKASAPRRPTKRVSDTVGISTFFHLDSRENRRPKSTSAV
jgi:hypothetical protein